MTISDRTLVVLTVIAILTTLGGTLTIVQHIGPDIPLLTGLATTDTGIVNVTIDAAVNIVFVVDVVDFESGVPDAANIRNINTSDPDMGGGNNPGGFANPGPFLIRNDGNVDVNVTINGTAADTFLGGTNPTYQFASTAPDNSDDGCPTNRTATTLLPMNATRQPFCLNLTFTDSADETNVSIFLGLPSDIPIGEKRDTVVEVYAERILSDAE